MLLYFLYVWIVLGTPISCNAHSARSLVVNIVVFFLDIVVTWNYSVRAFSYFFFFFGFVAQLRLVVFYFNIFVFITFPRHCYSSKNHIVLLFFVNSGFCC